MVLATLVIALQKALVIDHSEQHDHNHIYKFVRPDLFFESFTGDCKNLTENVIDDGLDRSRLLWQLK